MLIGRTHLERIRPIGTPGAPADATPLREQAALDEIADIKALLAVFETEADAVVAAAHQRAARIRSEADQSAQRIRADIPDRPYVGSQTEHLLEFTDIPVVVIPEGALPAR